MAGWHHGLDGRGSEWTPGDGDGQGGLARCDSWGRRESDTTERLSWADGPRRLAAHLTILPMQCNLSDVASLYLFLGCFRRLFEALKVRERSKWLRKLCKEYQRGLKHSEIITGHCETSHHLTKVTIKDFKGKYRADYLKVKKLQSVIKGSSTC